MKKLVLVFLLSPAFFFPDILFGYPALVQDTCTVNDDCQNAIVIANVVTDDSFVCINGCNLYASPESIQTYCEIQSFPTVWYKVTLDSTANLINLFVNADFESPTISFFLSETECDSLVPVHLTSSNLDCVVGTNGEAEAIGTSATPNTTYYIAISSLNSIGGHFDFCMNVLSTGSACVVDRTIQVTARSHGGPLEGPFDPDETVSICMNVNEYTAAGNGCQWFQGIIPVFGNGWDPSSFDIWGQPINTTLNGNPIGVEGNGNYGAATWDWFADIDFHYDDPFVQVGDLDGNGTLELCNLLYDPDCPDLGGLNGGCCGPCWGSPLGTILPPGWFAYGINGTCPTPGPPIRVDWGDGNTCGAGMGPWQFCFDLITRDVPDCLGDTTKRDLSLGFFTFSDGEVGSWTGSASVCALDRPMKMSLQAKCGRIVTHAVEALSSLCSGDTLRYQIGEPGITYWEWNISPFWAVPYLINAAENGFLIEAPLVNTTDAPVEISGILIGHTAETADLSIRKFKFTLQDSTSCSVVAVEDPKGNSNPDKNRIRIFPTPSNESAILEWTFDLQKNATIHIYNSQGLLMNSLLVSSQEGYQKQMDTQSLQPGVYFVSFSNSDFRYVRKLIKM